MRPSRLPLYLGVVLVVCGWAAIAVGWWQAGRQDLETGQLPYVISGGFGGFGLVLMGAVAVLIDFVRQAEYGLRRSAEDLHARMREVVDGYAARRPAPGSQRPAGDAAGQRRRRRRRRPAQSTGGRERSEEQPG